MTCFSSKLHPLTKAAGWIGAGSLACVVGCASPSGSSNMSNGAGSATTRPSSMGQSQTIEEMRASLDRKFVVGPTAASQFGYRATWNVQGSISGETSQAILSGDSLFVIDSQNNLSRIFRGDGREAWSWPVADPRDTVLGLRRSVIGSTDVLLALTEGDLHLFETTNGVQLDRHNLERVAATAPIVYGDTLIYGSLNGQLVWHHYGVDAYVGGQTLFGAISTPPQRLGRLVVAVSDRGHVMALDAGGGGQLWSQQTREGIVARPAITPQAVYVTSLDQFIRCYDIRDGQVAWSRLHSKPISAPPVVIGDKVYVQTDDLGLCCYEAFPFEDLDGELLWNTSDIRGTIIGLHEGNLMAWDDRSRTLYLADGQSGDLVEAVRLPKVSRLIIDGNNGEIYAVGDDGYITKLVPRG